MVIIHYNKMLKYDDVTGVTKISENKEKYTT